MSQFQSFLVRATPRGSVATTRTPAAHWPLRGVYSAESRLEAAEAASKAPIITANQHGVYETKTELVYVELAPR